MKALMERNFHNLVKSIYENPQITSCLMVKTKCFPHMIGDVTKMSTLRTFSQDCTTRSNQRN